MKNANESLENDLKTHQQRWEKKWYLFRRTLRTDSNHRTQQVERKKMTVETEAEEQASPLSSAQVQRKVNGQSHEDEGMITTYSNCRKEKRWGVVLRGILQIISTDEVGENLSNMGFDVVPKCIENWTQLGSIRHLSYFSELEESRTKTFSIHPNWGTCSSR